jgi:hypothetical protein
MWECSRPLWSLTLLSLIHLVSLPPPLMNLPPTLLWPSNGAALPPGLGAPVPSGTCRPTWPTLPCAIQASVFPTQPARPTACTAYLHPLRVMPPGLWAPSCSPGMCALGPASRSRPACAPLCFFCLSSSVLCVAVVDVLMYRFFLPRPCSLL